MRWAARSRSGAARSGRIRPTRLRLLLARKAPAPPELSNEPGGARGCAGVGGRGGHGRGADQGSVAAGVHGRVLRSGAGLLLPVAAGRGRGAVADRRGRNRAAADRAAQPGQGAEGPGVSRRARLVFFAVAAAALAATLGVGLAGLPSFGAQVSAYARMLNEVAPQQRHVTDVVSAIGFDYRGIDTLFEEFILLSAVAGISVLLRPLSDETRRLPQDKAPDRTIPPPSPAVWLLAVFLSSLLLLTGLETVTHGQLTPGGGFQGGVVLASGLYVAYLGTNYVTVERFQPAPLLEASDGVGASGYVFIGLLGLLVGASFLSNVVSLGVTGNLISGGTIPLLNLVVGVEVAASFAILASEFLDQTVVIRT